MKRKEFIKVMDRAIEKTKIWDDGDFTCLHIAYSGREMFNLDFSIVLETLSTDYAKVFDVSEKTFQSYLRDYSAEQLKNTRLTALELYKYMMLSTQGYKEIEL